MSAESALVLLVPEAEALVKPFRDRHDPAAAIGMPAHITLLYPFRQPDEVDGPVLDGLHQCFAGFAPFRFALTAIRRFESPIAVLYLAPEPTEPFCELTLAIWQRFPETPPYGGRHAAPVRGPGFRPDAARPDRRALRGCLVRHPATSRDSGRGRSDGHQIRALADPDDVQSG
jgi:hypothetical protein